MRLCKYLTELLMDLAFAQQAPSVACALMQANTTRELVGCQRTYGFGGNPIATSVRLCPCHWGPGISSPIHRCLRQARRVGLLDFAQNTEALSGPSERGSFWGTPSVLPVGKQAFDREETPAAQPFSLGVAMRTC